MSEWGSFFVDRGVFTHPAFRDDQERMAWLWLIAEATFQPREKRVGHVCVKLSRGQLAHSIRFMAKAWRWPEGKVRRFLARLARLKMIFIRTDEKATQITICNYDVYQPRRHSTGTAPAQHRHKLEECNKREGEGGAPVRAPASSISPEAFELARQFLIAINVDPENPELSGMSGAPYLAQMWLERGYDRALVLATVASHRDEGLKPFSYYTKCIESAHRKASEDKQREMPLLTPINGGFNEETRRDRGPAETWQQSRDDWRRARADLKARLYAADGACEGGSDDGGQDVRPVAAARRE